MVLLIDMQCGGPAWHILILMYDVKSCVYAQKTRKGNVKLSNSAYILLGVRRN